MADSSDATFELARWATARGVDELCADDVRRLEILLLDHLGCAVGGTAMSWARGLTDWALPYRGCGPALLLGGSLRTTPAVAAFANATFAHGLELDDTHDASLTHPGAGVVASALAVAAETGSPGAEVLAAATVGYEVTARVGMATGASILERGFHPTALFGGFGVAAAANHLYGGSAQDLVDAWGLLLSSTGGSCQFSQDARGTVVKRLHGGYGARSGIDAVQLARRGLCGPGDALVGKYGLLALFGSEDTDVAELMNDRAQLAIHELSLKPYPCCRLFHSTIDALRDALGDLPIAAPERVTRVRVGAPNVFAAQHMETRPTSMMSAQYSLPYCMAVALIDGPNDLEPYLEEALNDPARLAVGDRVECVTDDAMEDAFPQHFGSWVEVQLADGEIRRGERLDSVGTPAYPLSIDQVAAKTSTLLQRAGYSLTAETLRMEIQALGDRDDVAELLKCLAEGAPEREQA